MTRDGAASTASGPVATVIIPARDAEASVGQAVRGVRDQRDGAGRPVRVVVVDDGSQDRTGEVAAEAGAEVLQGEGRGPARARNLGVAAAETDLIVFTDADCAPCPGFVEQLLAPFAADDVAGAKGAYVTGQRSLVARFVQLEYEERYARMVGRMAARGRIDFIDTYAAAYRRQVFLDVGGFDERYLLPSTEDQELSFRIGETGARLVFVPEARVGHLHADSLWGYARKKAKIGFYKVATVRRHPGKAVSDSHTPGSLKLQLCLAPLVFLGLVLFGLAVGRGGSLGNVALASLAPWALVPVALFLLSALPLWLRIARADLRVGLVAPGLILVRATALGVGVALGILAELRGGVLPS